MPVKSNLGRLVKVALSEAWVNEARDFTPWLAQKENLTLLGETINLELELEVQEKNIGPFRADILCKDTLTGNWVLIENQIARTDHTHFGQIITYAAGLKAVTIVWIAEHFTDEHRAALDWLNEMTLERINFFGLEIELWKIGDSPLAPKFNIISQPNDWIRIVTDIAAISEAGSLTKTQKMYMDFWAELNLNMESNKTTIRPQKPYPQNWMNYPIGRTGFVLAVSISTQKNLISAGLYLMGDQAINHFEQLKSFKEEIKKEVGDNLDWIEKPENKTRAIDLTLNNIEFTNKDKWKTYFVWVDQKLNLLDKVFRNRIKYLADI